MFRLFYLFNKNISKSFALTIAAATGIVLNSCVTTNESTSSGYSASVVCQTGQEVQLSNEVVDFEQNFVTTISLDQNKYTNLKLPNFLTKVTSGGEDVVSYTYALIGDTSDKANLVIDKSLLKGSVIIYLNLVTRSWYEYLDWWNYCSDGRSGAPVASSDDIGRIVKVTLNGLAHKVRLIDIDHKEPGEKYATHHCTFEFVNTITAAGGSKYALCWNDAAKGGKNYDFTQSTLNDVLGQDGAIYNMIAASAATLLNKIKPVYKYVGTGTGSTKTATIYQTIFFPLSYGEMFTDAGSTTGVTANEGNIYKYYQDNTSSDSIKKETANGEAAHYWLRSPNSNDNSINAWYITTSGTSASSGQVNNFNSSVAPAFCI